MNKTKNETDNKKDLENDLSFLKSKVFPNIEDGSLLVITVGSEKTPAKSNDMEIVADTVNEIFEEIKGIRVLVVPHTIKIDKLSLPALRNIQSKVVNSWNDEDNETILDMDSLGIFGEV